MQQKINLWRINVTALRTIIVNDVIRFMRIWQQTLLPSAITMTLYFIIFGNFIGKHIGTLEGFSYMQFITPGLIMMAIITNSYSNVVSSFYSIRFQRSVEELLIAPVPNWLIVLGYTSGGIIRGVLNGMIVTMVALFFTHLHMQHPALTILVVLLTSVLFALAGFTNAIFARSFDDVAIIPTFVLTPLTYLGGVFYSIQQLPHVWAALSKLNPILYMVNSFRYGIIGISDVTITHAITVVCLVIVGLFWLNVRLMNKGVGIRS